MNSSAEARHYLQPHTNSWSSANTRSICAYMCLLILFVTVLVLVAVISARRPTSTIKLQQLQQLQQPQSQSRRVATQKKNSTSNSKRFATPGEEKEKPVSASYSYVKGAPLRWDSEEGAFMVGLGVGTSAVELVFDTGSSQVSVKGEGCRWTSCADAEDNNDSSAEVCVVQDCPLGGNTSSYVPVTGTFVNPGERGAGTSVTLTYGSQEDTVRHYLDKVYLTKLPPSHTGNNACDMLLQPPSQTHARSLPKHAIDNIIVHNVTAIKGTSTSNLFGFARAPVNQAFQKENGEFALIEQLFGGVKGESTHRWTLVLLAAFGWLLLSPPPTCFGMQPSNYVPLVTPRQFEDFVTHFYILPIVSLAVVVGEQARFQQVAPKDTPRFCIIDTGTTLTYGPPSLGAALRAQGYQAGVSGLRLVLGNAESNRVALVYTAKELVDPEYPDTALLQVDPETTLPDYKQLFGDHGVLLFGVLMMTHMVWDFDMSRKRVGIKRINSSSAK